MAYFLSNNVRVFPSTYRTVNASGKFTSETNFTNMIKALAGKDSFVVDLEVNTLKVVVKGYYFEIDNFTGGPNIWLRVNVNNGYLMSLGGSSQLDDASNFLGIESNSSGDLQVTNGDGKLINKGYIPELCDEDGNWFDLRNIFIKNNNGDIIINPTALKFDNPTYIENLVAQYATALYDSEGKKKISEGSNIKFTYFNNGVPVAHSGVLGSSTKPIFINNNGEFAASTSTVGAPGMDSNTIYLNKGTLTAGRRIKIDTNPPTPSSTDKAGDLWFVID